MTISKVTSTWLHLLLLTLLAACAPGTPSPATPTASAHSVTDYDALVQAFQAEGAAVQAGEEIFDPVFAVNTRFLSLPRTRVQVLEYLTNAEARAEAAKISADGFRVDKSAVDWVEPPHFYRVNRFVVLYVGRDEPTLDLLQRVLGPQFAGAPRHQPTPTIVYAPTVTLPTPAPTEALDQRTPTMIPPDLAQATIAARATASPFPTANAVAITLGQPARAIARRDGLSFIVELPKDNYLAGEGGAAQITFRNDGAETVFIGVGHDLALVMLLDEQGNEAPPYPWHSVTRSGPPSMAPLAPGQVFTANITFYAPPVTPVSEHHYVLWAWTQFSRLAPENGNGPDNIWLYLESVPIPLQISMPDISHQLIAQLEADTGGWHLNVTDGNGHVPNVPMSGSMEVATSNTIYGGPLNQNTQGEWSGGWLDSVQGNQTIVRVWVSAPGYTTARAIAMVPGSRSGKSMFDWATGPRLHFSSLEAARASVNLPLATPKKLPAGTRLDHVEVEDITYDSYHSITVWQVYHLPANRWLELTQMNSTGQLQGERWGQARYEPDAQQVRVAGSTAYLVKQFDWWVLDWKVDNVGFELHAPAQVISREQLLAIAESVQP